MKAERSRTKVKRMDAARAGRKVIVEFSQSLYMETEKATSELSMNRSALIRSAVREYLDKRRMQELERELAEGYLANASQARETAEAFSHVDSELP
jgi:metal-responsive CopG/Arc/MetJ family transcriptional regulator